VLARRASAGRYTVSDFLLYSSVCGTGLDVVPIPGDTPADRMARVMRHRDAADAAGQAPLGLLPIPGKQAGDLVTVDDPLLTSCRVMAPRAPQSRSTRRRSGNRAQVAANAPEADVPDSWNRACRQPADLATSGIRYV
jgi:uncharacterized protein (UPF0210 family)